MYSFAPNCSRGRVQISNFWRKEKPQVHLIIIKEWPKNSPPHFHPAEFYSTPLQLGTKEYDNKMEHNNI